MVVNFIRKIRSNSFTSPSLSEKKVCKSSRNHGSRSFRGEPFWESENHGSALLDGGSGKLRVMSEMDD